MYAASSTGAVVLKVTDAAGLTTTISFQVNAAGTTNTNATFALGALNLTPGKTVALDSVNLQFQTDGNFVVYANSGGTAVWAANVQNAACATSAGNCTASFQADGNLVLSSGGTAYWASSTSTQVGWTSYQLVFQDKAPYLVITDMSGNDLWDSTTENN
jgi:phage terminase large subunit-like protein